MSSEKNYWVPTPEFRDGEWHIGSYLSVRKQTVVHVVLVNAIKKPMNWWDAHAWAASQGGVLPTFLCCADLLQFFVPGADSLFQCRQSCSSAECTATVLRDLQKILQSSERSELPFWTSEQVAGSAWQVDFLSMTPSLIDKSKLSADIVFAIRMHECPLRYITERAYHADEA